MGVVSHAAWATLRIGGLLALIDVWQVALASPGALEPRTLLWLLALYAATVFLAALLAAVLVGRWWDVDVRRRVAAILLGAAACLFAQEVGLRALQPLSPWRPAVVVVALAVGLAVALAVWSVRRRRRAPWALPVGALLLAVGTVGAVRGFGGWGIEGQVQRPTPPAEAPSVLVVLIDTLRADHLGCYGYARPTSPHIDALAAESTLFTRAYSQSTWTKPATASLFTGRYPSQHQAYLEKASLPQSELLLPEALAQLGYRTAVFSGNPWITPDYGFSQGVDDFYSTYDERFARVTLYMMTLKRVSKLVDAKRRVYNKVKSVVLGNLSTTARDEHLTDQLIRWLDVHGGSPFFVHVHYMSPHHPYDPPAPFDRFVPDPTVTPVTAYPRKSYFFFDEGEEIPDGELADMIARYDGDVLFADAVVGRLLAALEARGLDERTILVLTSDHGEEFYDHRNWGHGQSVYEELTRVPLLVRHPPAFPAGRRIDTTVMTVDVMPTVLQLTGAGALPSLAGRSLLPVVAGEDSDRQAYSELLYRYGRAAALVHGRHKVVRMIRGDESRTELYDLAADPGERRATSADAVGLVDRLAAVEAWASAHRSAPAAEVHMDDEMTERLKALGYLE